MLEQQALQFRSVPVNERDAVGQLRTDTLMESSKAAHNCEHAGATLRAPKQKHLQRTTPPITNAPESILSAWTALEVLSPQTFRKPEKFASGDRSVTRIDKAELPWERGEKSLPKRRLYYQIVLGAIRMEPAMELLVERYGDTRIEKPSTPGYAALAVVIVDQRPVD